MMLLIYYNPNKNSFYLKRIHSLLFDKKVGDINQYNHILVQCLFIHDHHFLSCIDYWDYLDKTKKINITRYNNTVNKLIDATIDLLYKIKR